jgi:solute carrier family 25 S-adenosylmethionine transporter 26
LEWTRGGNRSCHEQSDFVEEKFNFDFCKIRFKNVKITPKMQFFFTKSLIFIRYPLDTAKTWRMARPHGVMREFTQDLTAARVYRGLGPKLVLYFPYQATYQVIYSKSKDFTGPYLPRIACVALSGACADIGSSFIRLPMEVIKQRMQSGAYTSVSHSLRSILTEEGLVNFYRSTFVPQTLLHDAPFSAVGWMCYETCMDAAGDRTTFSATKSLSLGALAGVIAATLTCPADVIKTRILTAKRDPKCSWKFTPQPKGIDCHVKGVLETYKEILATEGRAAFFRGLVPRILHIVPSHAMYMLIFERIRAGMRRIREEMPQQK